MNLEKLKKFLVTLLAVVFLFSFVLPGTSFSATNPYLGSAGTFGILSSTFTNTAGTTVNGDVGYTTPPAVIPTINGTTHVADSASNQAGTDQNSALGTLNAQGCDFNFNAPTDLSLLPQPLTPGVYCVAAAASIGTAGLTLNGSGTYVFKINGALTTVANSQVRGASACNVFWVPTQATTLGANSSFVGTDIDAAGITVGSTVTWAGRALAFGGTITTNTDTISVPSCSTPPLVVPPPPPTPAPVVAPVVVAPTVVVPMVASPVVVSPTVAVPLIVAPRLPKTGYGPEEKYDFIQKFIQMIAAYF